MSGIQDHSKLTFLSQKPVFHSVSADQSTYKRFIVRIPCVLYLPPGTFLISLIFSGSSLYC